MRAPTLFSIAILASAAAWAQPSTEAASTAATADPAAASSSQPSSEAPSRRNQRIERIRQEDAGSRVDELRVGGQTQSITVQPKAGNMPSYEVKPGNAGRDGTPQSGSDGTNGRRVWNINF